MPRMSHADQRQPMFSHAKDTWRTPKDLYRDLDAEFGGFDHDPCPPDHSADGLFGDWGERNYVNPPYGNGISRWLAKGLHEAMNGRLSVFLIPARTDTSWWHEYVMKADEVRFLRGRLHFDDSRQAAPFPSVVVVFRPRGGPSFYAVGAKKPSPTLPAGAEVRYQEALG